MLLFLKLLQSEAPKTVVYFSEKPKASSRVAMAQGSGLCGLRAGVRAGVRGFGCLPLTQVAA